MGVGMIINKQLFENIVEVRRKGDRILLVKLILGREFLILLVSAQVGLNESSKRQFWEDLDETVQGIPVREKNFISGDLNVGTSHFGFDSVLGRFSFGKK